MHKKNDYREKLIDFQLLTSKYEKLRQSLIVEGREEKFPVAFDWTNSTAVRLLTEVLLQEDFGVQISLPHDKLCPPLPNRLNYICWISDLVDLISTHKINMPIVGVDIGTGSSCIYPILGVKKFQWKFVGSDIDEQSLATARKNISNNQYLSDSIHLVHVSSSDSLQLLLPSFSQHVVKKKLRTNDHFQSDAVRCGEQLEEQIDWGTHFASMRASNLNGPIRMALDAMAEESRSSSTADGGQRETEWRRDIASGAPIAFCMCNPPFYDVDEEVR